MRRRIVLLCLLCLPTLGTSAWASPTDVIADYSADGVIDADYSVNDLRGALGVVQEQTGAGAEYAVFADLVSQALTQNLAGTSGSDREDVTTKTPHARTTTVSAPTPVTATPVGEGLPTPPAANPGEGLPMVVPIMGVIALGLVVAGTASAVWRRR